jgi:hypothetical protein
LSPSSLSNETDAQALSPDRVVKKVFRRILYIQARKFVPCWKEEKPRSAFMYVSCTRSSAAARSWVSQWAKL